MIRVDDEIVDFIAAGTTLDSVAHFEASPEMRGYVAMLIQKEKDEGLTDDEASELDHFLKLEHLMRLAKARARTLCTQ